MPASKKAAMAADSTTSINVKPARPALRFLIAPNGRTIFMGLYVKEPRRSRRCGHYYAEHIEQPMGHAHFQATLSAQENASASN